MTQPRFAHRPKIVGRRRGNARFWWAVHNLISHPLSEIAAILGYERLSNRIHDWSIPIHEAGKGRG